MIRRISAFLCALAIAFTLTATAADPAHARDTGWDCPGCIVIR